MLVSHCVHRASEVIATRSDIWDKMFTDSVQCFVFEVRSKSILKILVHKKAMFANSTLSQGYDVQNYRCLQSR